MGGKHNVSYQTRPENPAESSYRPDSLISVLRSLRLNQELDRFIELSVASLKWKKWLVNDSTADALEKTRIAGHYTFACPEVIEIKSRAQSLLQRRGENLDEILQTSIRTSINRYIRSFNLI